MGLSAGTRWSRPLGATCAGLLLVSASASVAVAGQPPRADSAAPDAAPPPPALPGAPAPSASAPPAAAPEGAKLEQARALFRSGVAMLNTGDYERALDYFLRSREAYPSPPNTINAALCLDRLGRYDESLELYETALATLGDKLDAQDTAAISAATTQLLRKVGKLDVSSNVSGVVIVDGRQRGSLPLRSPLRTLAGTHVVRVVKDGYRTFEATVEVKPGERFHVDARLEPLESAGQLRIEDPGHDGADVLVDGAVVGQSPWEGTLGPGSHAVWSRFGDTGSAPTAVVVLQGQTALVRLKSGPLGPPVRIVARPETAALTLSGVVVGRGSFESRLPAGAYEVVASEPGYFPRTVPIKVDAAAGATTMRVPVVLVVDPNDPRWPRPVPLEIGHFWVGAFAGVGWGPSLGSSAEAGCPSHCSGTPDVLAFTAGARAGFRFRFKTSIELTAGYAAMDLTSTRSYSQAFGGAYTATYTLHDDVRLAGPLIGLGASQLVPLVGKLSLVPRLTIGLLFGNVRDPVTGTVSTGAGSSTQAVIPDAGDTVGALRTLVSPELGATLPWKGFDFGLAVQASFVLGPDVDLDYSVVEVASGCSSRVPGGAGCADKLKLGEQRALSPFYVFVPILSVSREF